MAGFGEIFDKGADIVGRGIDWGMRKAGEGVDAATDALGDRLKNAGAGAFGEALQDWGDGAASWLGAEVREAELGTTTDPHELIHGKAGDITDTVTNLRDFQSAFTGVGRGLNALGSEGWRGKAEQAFAKKLHLLPQEWQRASDAFESAANALEAYAHTVTWAQGKAYEAIELYRQGDEATRQAAKEHAEHPSQLNVASAGEPVDPGDRQRAHARELLADVRRQRDEAAERAKGAIASALAHAPATPSARDRLGMAAGDTAIAAGTELLHVGGGVLKGAIGTTNFVRAINPMDAYNLTHPAAFLDGTSMTLAGIASTVAHPDRVLTGAWEALKSDPSEFLGRLLPDILGSKGAGAAKSLSAARQARRLEDIKAPARGSYGESPHASSREPGQCHTGNDPVDMATGRFLLPQTDLSLPASLPLVLNRTFESAYRSGRWFGPSWASTLDQRLEIDSEGVLLLREDGGVLAFPHPAPGVPVLPTHGISRWSLDREGEGGAYTVTDPRSGVVRRFAVSEDGTEAVLVQIDDRNGNWITFGYDEHGTPTDIAHHAGYRLRLATDGSRITALYLGTQEVRHYGYTDSHLTSVADSSGLATLFGYDELGRMTSWTDSNGVHYENVYDDRHRCVFQSGRDGVMAGHFTWPAGEGAAGETTLTDALGRTTRYEVDDRALVTAVTEPDGAVTRYTHDARGRELSRTDPLGHVTRFAYDREGRLTTVTRPDGRTTGAEYDELGLPVRITGPDGNRLRQTYDERGNRTSVTSPSGARTAFTYDDRGRITAVTDPLGAVTRVHSDPAGLPMAVTDPLGATSHYERDPFGRTIRFTDPLGARTELEWTVEGRLARRTTPDGAVESWTYDGEGNCLVHTDPIGGTTRFTYGAFDLPTSRTDPDGTRHTFTHDAALQLTSVTNPQGMSWSYSYDGGGRTASETDFDGRTLSYTYDAAGRLASRTNTLGRRVSYERNVLGQVVRKDADGAVTTYDYDIFDELAVAAGPDATLTRLRDRYGRLLSETVDGRTLSFTYDTAGRRTGRTTPGGAVSTWSYDAAGRCGELTASGRKISFEHDPAGRELTRTLGDFTSLISSFDEAGRLASHEVTGRGRRLQHRAYHYRPDGGLVGIDDELAGPRRFDLDAAGRVTAVHADRWTERYVYDEAGNQTDAAWPGPGSDATGTRSYTGTRITRAGAVRYEHDALGRVTSRRKTRLSRKPDTWHYTWDAEDRLTSVTTPDGTEWRYAYDPLGRRVSKHSPTETVHFTWDGTTLCEQSTESVTLTWDHAGLRPLSQTERRRDTEETRFFAIVTDLVGTPTELVDESGELAWRARSTLWGTTAWTRAATAYTPLRFPGQYFDPESGLHYNFFRYYDPEPARYLTPDPLGLAPAPNPATYVHNPHTWSDPLGLMACPIGGPEKHIPLNKARGDVHFPDHESAWQEILRRFDIEDSSYTHRENMHGKNDNLKGPKGESWEEISAIDRNGNPVEFHHHSNGHYFREKEPALETWSLPHYHGPNGEHVYYGDMNSGWGLKGVPRSAE
ncbi:putative T7SS-secreted protein [Streptomyces sp. NPDC046203]|uniref:putative T7SS-secreted protein n=1 Tax=Streptomyces sp. NPDC046203 TaxID=3154602 RepID=UPI0033C85228